MDFEPASVRVFDKNNVLPDLHRRPSVELDLGCGPHKRTESMIGIDHADFESVDLVGDVFDVLAQFPTSSVDKIYSSHFFEHVAEVRRLMEELARIVKPGGSVDVIVPHFSNPYFYSDYTHRAFFGLYTMSYLVDAGSLLRRRVPAYGKLIAFQLIDVQLRFASPFIGRHLVRKSLLGAIFNSCRALKEFYEENLCYVLPCYEILFALRRV